MIYTSIGNTPMITLSRLIEPGRVFVKLEKNNPAGSIKDRPAFFMIKHAEINNELNETQNIIVEPTSGNTGIALAAIGKSKGYRVILTMPESMSEERKKILKILGAELILTPAEQGMKGAISKAIEIVEKTKGFMPNQFANPANPYSHEVTTGPEIIKQMDYSMDVFVSGVGTGGTITGVAKALKKTFSDCVRIVAVEPANSSVLSGGNPGPHMIQGIGAGFIPDNLNMDLIDEVMQITDEEAINMTRELSKLEGLFVGISSGANIAAALKLATRFGKGRRIVTIAPDSGDKYMSLL
ncbi:MAG TPA: cysteine synthase A [Defluviitoga tunisiensis]|uniref:Cysteine synthase n=1 Tax=Defluviitoga tunisiensis TaxID=1006576 RepID=A0A0C7NST0_DEFTU|nr:cysteine synthase A [Defluviitoga tunisiensis]MDD3600731.1 cysteine synthase A [Defluviitoga tunisiensis]CEP78852.1 cysteine synthase [Defluviitoga tunisiensis]HOB55437.1 cysteine synthase A [Defluviitoga tunisiensis]HOL86663.1 cysteine synthase A [Defluviitoga tunisiensis]HOP33979.1 cysteine synthase A [Defluviitoga tunisiensis]